MPPVDRPSSKQPESIESLSSTLRRELGKLNPNLLPENTRIRLNRRLEQLHKVMEVAIRQAEFQDLLNRAIELGRFIGLEQLEEAGCPSAEEVKKKIPLNLLRQAIDPDHPVKSILYFDDGRPPARFLADHRLDLYVSQEGLKAIINHESGFFNKETSRGWKLLPIHSPNPNDLPYEGPKEYLFKLAKRKWGRDFKVTIPDAGTIMKFCIIAERLPGCTPFVRGRRYEFYTAQRDISFQMTDVSDSYLKPSQSGFHIRHQPGHDEMSYRDFVPFGGSRHLPVALTRKKTK